MDWRRFLEENNIHFVDRGPNTKRGEVSIHCPMCGDDDPSEHLGINLTTGKWGCLRDGSHRGKSARHLIKNILGCSSAQSFTIVKQYSHSDPDSLEAALTVLEGDTVGVTNHDEDVAKLAKHQALGPQFKDFYQIKPRGITKRFFTYLQERGYDNPTDIIKAYDLRCAMTGRYKDRIIIPAYLNSELMGWTSRAIGIIRNAPRYLASSDEVKTTVFNFDELKKGGQRLFIVEGPFDAIRMDSYAVSTNYAASKITDTLHDRIDFRATCTFGTSLTVSQIALLRTLVKRFDQAWVLFDRGAEGPATDLASWIDADMAYLPHYIDDPGELPHKLLSQLTSKFFDGWFG